MRKCVPWMMNIFVYIILWLSIYTCTNVKLWNETDLKYNTSATENMFCHTDPYIIDTCNKHQQIVYHKVLVMYCNEGMCIQLP